MLCPVVGWLLSGILCPHPSLNCSECVSPDSLRLHRLSSEIPQLWLQLRFRSACNHLPSSCAVGVAAKRATLPSRILDNAGAAKVVYGSEAKCSWQQHRAILPWVFRSDECHILMRSKCVNCYIPWYCLLLDQQPPQPARYCEPPARDVNGHFIRSACRVCGEHGVHPVLRSSHLVAQ